MIQLRCATAGIQAGIGKSLLLVSLLSLGACASFPTHPEPVGDTIPFASSANINLGDALTNFASDDASHRHDLTPKAYRDMVIAIYVAAVDMRYSQFRGRLAGRSRGSSLPLGIGIQGAVSREPYFDRIIPTIIAVMDAERARIRRLIMANLRKSAEEYPLAAALSDVLSYEAAASLDRAVEILAREAADRTATANLNDVEE